MTQPELAFPPPMTPRQLAGAEKLARMVEATRQSERIVVFRRHRAAAKKGVRRG